MQTRTRLFSTTTALLLLAAALIVIPSATANAAVKDQCVVKVVGNTKDNNFILGPQVCYATFAEVLQSLGDANAARSASPTSVSTTSIAAASIIGIHYENASQGGASYTVSGSSCTGGGLHVPASWNDRISSTRNGCGHIVHYEHANYAGATYSTFGGGGNITGYMDNRTTSIKYFS